jgi:hypothetical protein
VFTWPDGSPIHPLRFSRWFEQHARRAGLPKIRLHDLPGLDREAAATVARLILGGGNAIPEASVNKPLASGRRREDEQDG